MTVYENHKNTSVRLEPILEQMLNKILVCEKRNGKRFSAKLVGINGNQLFFETRDGEITIDNLANIKTASVLRMKAVV